MDEPNQPLMRREDGGQLQAAPMNADEVYAQVRLVQQIMAKVMQEGQHFGTIPGTDKNKLNLLLPGAEKLGLTFRLAPEYQVQERDFPGGHREYLVICTQRSILSGKSMGQGVGVCSTMESKYRYRNARKCCPLCGQATIIREKAEYMRNGQVPGWVCWKKDGVSNGCNARWAMEDPVIANQPVGKVENADPADQYNTCVKMAKKRAQIDATKTALAVSDMFTQDQFEEDEHDAPPPVQPQQPQQPPQQQPRQQQGYQPQQPAYPPYNQPQQPQQPLQRPQQQPPQQPQQGYAMPPPRQQPQQPPQQPQQPQAPKIPKEVLTAWMGYLEEAASNGKADANTAWQYVIALPNIGPILKNLWLTDGTIDRLKEIAEKADIARMPMPPAAAPPATPPPDLTTALQQPPEQPLQFFNPNEPLPSQRGDSWEPPIEAPPIPPEWEKTMQDAKPHNPDRM